MPLQISRIQSICFDVDGTLSYTDDVMVAQLARLLQPFYFLLPKENVFQAARRMVMAAEAPANFFISIPDLIGLDNELYALADWIARIFHSKVKNHWMVPDTIEMLDKLSKHYPLAVVSARDTRTTMDFLNQFNLAAYFNCFATDQTCQHTKPFPDPILWTARHMGVSPEACLMVGDTTVDIRAGQAAGAQTVGVLSGFGEEKELHQHGSDLILSKAAELVQVLEE
jgi:N-acetyl-D-muramate 6-phosphate phosphatase